jgi:putative DNA primase/helicase
VRNGYVIFAPHDPGDLITKLAPVDYDPAAARPAFDTFLAEVQPQAENRRFLAQWHGLSATGETSEQKLAVYWGKGRNGKSTLIDALAHVLGDYSETVPIETFLAEGKGRNAGAATPDLAILPGVRFLRTSEPDRGAKLAEALIKLVTGGEPILARHLNRDYFRFYPQFKLTISGNYRPEIRGSDEGIWRRVQLVPWTVTIAKEKIDPDLGSKLQGEASGILNWLLDGLCDWLDNRLTVPADVTEATDSYRAESDPLGRFLAVCTERAEGLRVQSSVLHRLFLAWAKANCEREWSAQGFGRAMREKGYKSVNSQFIWWVDINTTRRAEDFDTGGPSSPTDPAPPVESEEDYR